MSKRPLLPGSVRPLSSTARLRKDYLRLKRDPVPYINAEPLPENILEWHFCVRGPEDSPYHGGFYHGWLVFPYEFPFRPPAIYMRTPSGRFKTNTRLCLSISDFHPDTWNPAWSVATILTGLLSFMLESTPTLGSIEAGLAERRQYAAASLRFNLRNEQFCALFPDEVAAIRHTLRTEYGVEDVDGYANGDDGNAADADDDNDDGYFEFADNLRVNAANGNAAALVRPLQRGRERRERHRDEKALQLIANANRRDAAAPATARVGQPAVLGGVLDCVALADWRTLCLNAVVLLVFGGFVAVAVHVIRALGED